MPGTTRYTLLAAAAMAMAGNAAMADADPTAMFRTQQSADDARHQLAGWIPPASPLVDAVTVLQNRGFQCRKVQPMDATARSTLLCSLAPAPTPAPDQRMTTPLTPIQWFVTLDSADGTTVSTLRVNRIPDDLGH